MSSKIIQEFKKLKIKQMNFTMQTFKNLGVKKIRIFS